MITLNIMGDRCAKAEKRKVFNSYTVCMAEWSGARLRELVERLDHQLSRLERARIMDEQEDIFELKEMFSAPPEQRYGEAVELISELRTEVELVQDQLVTAWLKSGGAVATLARVGDLNRGTLIKKKKSIDEESQ
ncbi:hypothetical protein SAMN04489751_0767 [Brevibacterium sandarakinum]|uniref:Uncharacterized protein n=2 Tax=Brevibacteriaceae TaxID=85019 RepID=A0A1H1MV44_BRESA|nr:hypothetical protein CIK63_04655 [Brevibacterium aurantiacum]SDR90557.1 hypothetical protein SAMN04489751_0767 [Brevibacterium sandarakinum]